MNNQYTCSICGLNHPTEIHDQLAQSILDRDRLQELEKRKKYSKLLDPHYLPRRDEVNEAFAEQGFEGPDLARMIRHETGYEILNRELIEELSFYLTQRAAQYSKDRPPVILEVGAGNGRLTHFLNWNIQSVKPDIKIIATDSGNHGDYVVKPIFPVEKLDDKEALTKYTPTIVICSWMPDGVDFTEDFRRTASVQEYILVGQMDGVGDSWKTWGIEPEHDHLPADLHIDKRNKKAPYIVDGFDYVHVQEAEEVQSHHTDVYVISFRRKEKK